MTSDKNALCHVDEAFEMEFFGYQPPQGAAIAILYPTIRTNVPKVSTF